MKQRIRAAVILVEDERMLLVKHVNPRTGKEKWIPPGGGLEDQDASVVECAVREVFEETGLQVSIGKLVYFREFQHQASDTHQLELYFLADEFRGTLTIEHAKGKGPDEHSIQEVRWIRQEEISGLTVYPPLLSDSFWEDMDKGFPEVRYLGVDAG